MNTSQVLKIGKSICTRFSMALPTGCPSSHIACAQHVKRPHVIWYQIRSLYTASIETWYACARYQRHVPAITRPSLAHMHYKVWSALGQVWKPKSLYFLDTTWCFIKHHLLIKRSPPRVSTLYIYKLGCWTTINS